MGTLFPLLTQRQTLLECRTVIDRLRLLLTWLRSAWPLACTDCGHRVGPRGEGQRRSSGVWCRKGLVGYGVGRVEGCKVGCSPFVPTHPAVIAHLPVQPAPRWPFLQWDHLQAVLPCPCSYTCSQLLLYLFTPFSEYLLQHIVHP